jgi:hypothetical protein
MTAPEFVDWKTHTNLPVEYDVKKAKPKPVDVYYMQVTAENVHEVANWCRGRVYANHLMGQDPLPHIKLDLPRANRADTELLAYVGNYVVLFGMGFKVYTETAFEKTFDRL